jgi:hypothetical protein
MIDELERFGRKQLQRNRVNILAFAKDWAKPLQTPVKIASVLDYYFTFFYLVCEATGTAATPGLLRQPRVIVKMIVEKQMECRLAGETEVLGENLPQSHFCSSQNPTWPDPGLNPGRRGGKPGTNRLSYGVAVSLIKFEWNTSCYLRLKHSQYASLLNTCHLYVSTLHACASTVKFLSLTRTCNERVVEALHIAFSFSEVHQIPRWSWNIQTHNTKTHCNYHHQC